MWIRILGSAAGGGLPQWNCRCPNCAAVRAGSVDIQPRTQSSVAVSADGEAWFLLNASADVRAQILSFPDLGPPAGKQRGTRIAGCVLTDAEIDHTSGLLQLREGCTFPVFSTPTVHHWLSRYFPIETVLASFADRPWTELPLDRFLRLPLSNGLKVRAFETGREVPRFVPDDSSASNGSPASNGPPQTMGARVGLQIEDTNSGGVLVYAPGVSSIDDALTSASEAADCVLIDGTFWTDDEPIEMGITHRTARLMGHLPVSGPAGSLQWLESSSAAHRVYIHINNTNPMLNDRGPQRKQVNQAGVRVAADGDAFEL